MPVDESWHGFVAGILAGVAGVVVGHPFDTVKVRMQTGDLQRAQPFPSEVVQRSLLKRATSLYRGILPPLLTTGCLQSLSFGVFENSR
jgi:hypothetical protein